MRNLTLNALVMACSLIATLGAVEAYLRWGMDPERLVPNAPETPTLNERRNALRFLSKSREKGSVSNSGHDRRLGWDMGHPDTRVRGLSVIPAPDGRRAVALGDSFVWGNEVAEDENFAALLDRADNGLQVLNMGVPGYGIDQAILKYELHGADYKPDVVILGIYVSDYERSTVAFTAAAKPLFMLLNDELVLTNSPVPAPAAVLEQIERSLSGRFRLREFVTSRLPGARQTPDAFFQNADRVIGLLLRRLRDSLGPDQRLLILHIPRGESFAAPDPFHAQMDRHLRDLYQALRLEVVDLAEAFNGRADGQPVAASFYRVRESGSVGHLNPAGHAVAAETIGSVLSL